MRSLGYLLERSNVLKIDLSNQLARVSSLDPLGGAAATFDKKQDTWGYTHSSSIHVTGRIVLNLWRILRSEVKLNNYSRENLILHITNTRFCFSLLNPQPPLYLLQIVPDPAFVFVLFKQSGRVPVYSDETLTSWFGNSSERWRVLEYYKTLTYMNLAMLTQLDIIERTRFG
jgi:DNA polymerase zeta